MGNMVEFFDQMVDYSSQPNRPEIIYIYSSPQERFEKLKDKAKFFHTFGHSELDPENLKRKRNLAIFIDDSVNDQHLSPAFLSLIYTVYSHHLCWLVLY